MRFLGCVYLGIFLISHSATVGLADTVYHFQNGKLIPVDNVQQMQAYEQQSVRSGNRVFSVLLVGGALVAVVVAVVVYRRLRWIASCFFVRGNSTS